MCGDGGLGAGPHAARAEGPGAGRDTNEISRQYCCIPGCRRTSAARPPSLHSSRWAASGAPWSPASCWTGADPAPRSVMLCPSLSKLCPCPVPGVGPGVLGPKRGHGRPAALPQPARHAPGGDLLRARGRQLPHCGQPAACQEPLTRHDTCIDMFLLCNIMPCPGSPVPV